MLDVFIEEVGICIPADLSSFVDESGFDSLAEWLNIVIAFYGKLPEVGWLYRVELLKKREVER